MKLNKQKKLRKRPTASRLSLERKTIEDFVRGNTVVALGRYVLVEDLHRAYRMHLLSTKRIRSVIESVDSFGRMLCAHEFPRSGVCINGKFRVVVNDRQFKQH